MMTLEEKAPTNIATGTVIEMSKYGKALTCKGFGIAEKCINKPKWHVQDNKGHYYFCNGCYARWKEYGKRNRN